MYKRLIVPLSSLMVIASVDAANLSDIELRGFLVTQECMKKGEFNDCPREQLTQLSENNRLVLFQGDEQKAYVLDLSNVDKADISKFGIQNDIIVSGILQPDGKTIQVQKLKKYVMQPVRWKGRM